MIVYYAIYFRQYLCPACLLPVLIIVASMSYAYIVNARRDANDPKKREYSPRAMLIAPFSAPFLLMLAVFLFILRALLFFAFIVVFTIALIVIRKPFFLEWLRKIALKIGEPLLRANTYLIRLVFNPETINQT